MLKKPLRGVIPPMITPLKDREHLDAEGTARLVEHILAGHVHGLFLLGTTGEAPDLSAALRYELVRQVCHEVKGRVPVLVGITDTVFSESIDLANKAAELGADAVVATTPYYFSLGQPELIDYYTRLARQQPLPLFLYNMPSHTKTMIALDTVRELSQNPKISGIKDSSGDIVYFNKILHMRRERKDFSVLIGPEEALAEVVLMGADGGVCGGANLFPQLYADLYNAAVAGDLTRVRELQCQVMSVSASLYGVGHHMSSFVKGVKCSLSLMGICGDAMTQPFDPFLPADRELIRARLRELGVDTVAS